MDGFEFWMSFDRSAAEGSWKQEREEGEEQKGTAGRVKGQLMVDVAILVLKKDIK